MKNYKNIALAALCLALPTLSLAQDNDINDADVEIYLSATELDEMFNNPDRSYVCLNNQISELENVINAIDQVDAKENSPLKAYKSHIELGYSIGREDAILQVLDYAKEALNANRSLLTTEEVQTLEDKLTTVVNQIEQGAINLNAEKLAFLKDEFYKSQELENADQTDEDDQNNDDSAE
jgi:hypothetical protein